MTTLPTQSARAAKKSALWTPWGNMPHRPSASPRQRTDTRAGKLQKTPVQGNSTTGVRGID